MGENERDSLTAQVFGQLPFSLFLLVSREVLEAEHRFPLLLLPFHLCIPVKSSMPGKGELFPWWEAAEL